MLSLCCSNALLQHILKTIFDPPLEWVKDRLVIEELLNQLEESQDGEGDEDDDEEAEEDEGSDEEEMGTVNEMDEDEEDAMSMEEPPPRCKVH
jgi:hypothetical protein